MKQTRILWDMPITVELRDGEGSACDIEAVYGYFRHVDDVFSTFKKSSEISRINRGEVAVSDWSRECSEVIRLCEATKRQTGGFFSHMHHGIVDPLGMVKGWAIHNAADALRRNNVNNFYIDAGGDMEISGHRQTNEPWRIGIRDPFHRGAIVKTLALSDCGIATSGTYIRGDHIYDPVGKRAAVSDVVSLTVVGPNAYEADRFATAAFAMGEKGIKFILALPGFEGYQINARGIATFTPGFERFVATYELHHWAR